MHSWHLTWDFDTKKLQRQLARAITKLKPDSPGKLQVQEPALSAKKPPSPLSPMFQTQFELILNLLSMICDSKL